MPWPGRTWDIQVVASPEPGTTQATFPAVWNNMRVLATLTASGNEVALEPLADQRLVIPRPVWMKLAPFATVASLAHSPPGDLPLT